MPRGVGPNKIQNCIQMCVKWAETPKQYGWLLSVKARYFTGQRPQPTQIHTPSHYVYVGYYHAAAVADNI